jgi:hypothetical protein
MTASVGAASERNWYFAKHYFYKEPNKIVTWQKALFIYHLVGELEVGTR